MALSGTFYGTTSNDYIQPKIVWKATQSVSGNYSTVTATLYYSRTNTGYTTKGTGSFSLTINGKKATASKYVTLTYKSNTVAITHKVQVTHDADGTKDITISATGSISGTTLSSTSISNTVTLDTIPRATTPTLSASSVFMGDNVTITLDRASSSFTHDLAYKFAGSTWQSIRSGVGTSYTWPVPDLSSSIEDATSGTLTIRCITKNGSTTIGTKTISMTVKVPTGTSYQPKIKSVTVTEAVTTISSNFNIFIQNKSKIKVVIDAEGAAGSDIKSYSTTFLGSTYTGSSWTTSGVISQSGSLKLVTTVTDTRGRTAKATTIITVQPYFKPKVSVFEVKRATALDKFDEEGEYLQVVAEGSVPGFLQNMDDDKFSVTIAYKESVASSDTWTTLRTYTADDYGELYTGTTGGAFSLLSFINNKEFTTDKQFDIRITAKDFFGASSSIIVVLPSGVVIADIKANGKGIGIGKVAEIDDAVDSDWKFLLNKGARMPANILWDAADSTSTNGWYMADSTEQIVTLSQNISEQLTGAVFAWSAYDATGRTGLNQDWHFFFVPKHHVKQGGAHGVWMCDAYMGLRKYVYVNDATVTGHTNNNKATSTNGIAFDNTKYVLRYIVGV